MKFAKKKIYLHGSKEDGYELAEELGIDPDSEAGQKLKYACYEVALDVEINKETGDVLVEKVTYGDQVLIPESFVTDSGGDL